MKLLLQDVSWGGCSGCFSDPGGHLREVAHNKFVLFSGKAASDCHES